VEPLLPVVLVTANANGGELIAHVEDTDAVEYQIILLVLLCRKLEQMVNFVKPRCDHYDKLCYIIRSYQTLGRKCGPKYMQDQRNSRPSRFSYVFLWNL